MALSVRSDRLYETNERSVRTIRGRNSPIYQWFSSVAGSRPLCCRVTVWHGLGAYVYLLWCDRIQLH